MENNDYLEFRENNRLFFDARKLPKYDKKDFYESIYDTDPKRFGTSMILDKSGQKFVIDTILDKIPDEFVPYKTNDYTLVSWYREGKCETEYIEIFDNDYKRGILVKLH